MKFPFGVAYFQELRLMEEILHQLIGHFSHYLQGFIHPRWCRISSINRMLVSGKVVDFFWLGLHQQALPALPSRERSHIPPKGKWKSILVGSQEGNKLWTNTLPGLPETNIAHENPIFPCKYHQNGGFSMAMLVSGRVQPFLLEGAGTPFFLLAAPSTGCGVESGGGYQIMAIVNLPPPNVHPPEIRV